MAHEKSRPGNTGTSLLLTNSDSANTDRDFDYDQRGPVTARSVSWWSVHEYVTGFIGTLTDWPMAGTPEWCDLDDYEPRKLAAVLIAGSHHALRVETAQEANAAASKAVAAAADWPAIAKEIHQLHNWRSTRPWAIRQAVNHVA